MGKMPMNNKQYHAMMDKKKKKMPARALDNDSVTMPRKKAMNDNDADDRMAKRQAKDTKKSGTFDGKSNKLGQGGRAAQLKAQGVPGGVIGDIARSKQAAPGQKNFHRKRK